MRSASETLNHMKRFDTVSKRLIENLYLTSNYYKSDEANVSAHERLDISWTQYAKLNYLAEILQRRNWLFNLKPSSERGMNKAASMRRNLSEKVHSLEELTGWHNESVYMFVEALFGTLITTGNGIILFLIFRRKLLGQSTNVFIFSLATADFLNGLFALPMGILSKIFRDEYAVYLCKGSMYILFMTKTTVAITIVMLTWDKVSFILQPTKSVITAGRCMFITSLIWFFSAAFNVWKIVLYTSDASNHNFSNYDHPDKVYLHTCSLSNRFTFLYDTMKIMDMSVSFVIPFIIIVGFLILLATKCFTELRERIIGYVKIVRLIVSLFTVMCVCHLPMEILTFLQNRSATTTSSFLQTFRTISLIYYTRGFWTLFIYGYFKHYVCRKQRIANANACQQNHLLQVPTGDNGDRTRESITSL